MTIEASEFSATEQDALAEIANMGVSRAAVSLRQMVGEQVLLSVPAVRIVSRATAAALVDGDNAPKLVAVQQSFEGRFSGLAMLIFPQAQSLELVRSIVGEDHSPTIERTNSKLCACGKINIASPEGEFERLLHSDQFRRVVAVDQRRGGDGGNDPDRRHRTIPAHQPIWRRLTAARLTPILSNFRRAHPVRWRRASLASIVMSPISSSGERRPTGTLRGPHPSEAYL